MSGLVNSLLGLGHPLLDIIATVDEGFLDSFGLKLNNQVLAEDKHKPLFKALAEKPGMQYVPGGATQSSISVAQWMLQVPGATSFMGCIGKDDFGVIMADSAKANGVNIQYMVDEKLPTGTCGTCILDGERSLVANLAAAGSYQVEHLRRKENWVLLEKARVIYTAGFFITTSADAIMDVARHAADHNKIYGLNLSAPFIMQVPTFRSTLMGVLPYVDFLFGNDNEACIFAKAAGWQTRDVADIALRISMLPKQNGSRPRTVIFTQGANPTVMAHMGQAVHIPVIPLEARRLVDTNGAGDAFVGGFLSQLVAGKGMYECCHAGHVAAHVILQRSGCTFPNDPPQLG